MGATQSIESDNSIDLKKSVDLIATKYILSQKFQDLINLKDKNYCKNLVILTSKILNSNLNRQQITYLAEYNQGNKLDKSDVLYFKYSELENLDEKDKDKKDKLCIGISAFYIKINYIFAAILTTLKPVALMKKIDSDEHLDEVAAEIESFESHDDEKQYEKDKLSKDFENQDLLDAQ
jgi:hypothetical protein